MSYIINNSRGNIVAVIPDGSVNTSTSLTLIGQGVTNYGTDQNENLVSNQNEIPKIKPK